MPKKLANGKPFEKSTASAATIVVSRSSSAKKLVDCLNDNFTAEKFWAKVEGLLEAKRAYPTKDGDVIEVPDYNVQLATLKFLYEAKVGKPREQEIEADKKPASDESSMEQLRKMCELSPMFLGEMEKMITQIKGKTNAIES